MELLNLRSDLAIMQLNKLYFKVYTFIVILAINILFKDQYYGITILSIIALISLIYTVVYTLITIAYYFSCEKSIDWINKYIFKYSVAKERTLGIRNKININVVIMLITITILAIIQIFDLLNLHGNTVVAAVLLYLTYIFIIQYVYKYNIGNYEKDYIDDIYYLADMMRYIDNKNKPSGLIIDEADKEKIYRDVLIPINIMINNYIFDNTIQVNLIMRINENIYNYLNKEIN